MDWSTDIQTSGFGEAVEQRWLTVRSWQSFKGLFEDAVHLEGVTYCESPSLLLELLEDEQFSVESLKFLIGDREEYQSSLDDIPVARRLQDHYTAGNLTVRLKKRKVDHSKLYRAVDAEGNVTLVVGSANLSYNSWKNQANSLVVYHTSEGSQFDQRFRQWIRDQWEDYGNEIFMEDLVEQLQQIDDEEDRERYLELWVDNRTNQLSERGEVHTDISEELERLGQDVQQATSVEDEAEDPDTQVTIEQEQRENTTEDDDSEPAITAAKTPDIDIKLSTQAFDPDGYASKLESHLKTKGAKVSSNSLSIPVQTYTNYLEEQYDEWRMWIDESARKVHLQIGEEHRILTADERPSGDELDAALANIEEYIETVRRWGETNQEEAVMAHMYEGILYGLWAPFINLYGRSFYGNSTLDKSLPYLFIFGNSDAGKDQFTRFVLQLLSDGLVEGGADGDDMKKRKIRALREIDTIFPFVVSDISKQRIENADPLRNFWADSWQPDLRISYPAIIFTSNDSRPNEWFRNRAKMIHFDVVFPSNPEDEYFHEAQRDLNSILDERNPIFSYVSIEVLHSEPYRDTTSTISDIRTILLDFYERADRPLPKYFPEKGPAEKHYSVGKRKWENAFHRGDVSFSQLADAEGHLIADFDLEGHEVYAYRKVLPKQMRPEKSGRSIIIKNPDRFIEWLDVDPLSAERSSWVFWISEKLA